MVFGQCKDMAIKFVNSTGLTITIPSEGHKEAYSGWVFDVPRTACRGKATACFRKNWATTLNSQKQAAGHVSYHWFHEEPDR